MSITKLEKFLINRGLLEVFIKNIKTIGEEPFKAETFFFKYSGYPLAIAFPFSWSRSPEGSDFWDDISNEWVTILVRNEL